MFEAEKMLNIAKRAWENLEKTENVDDFHMYWIAAVTSLLLSVMFLIKLMG